MALPPPKRLHTLLEEQVGRTIRLTPADPLTPTTRGLWFAVYVDEHLSTVAVTVADAAAAAYLGAAALLVPRGVATTALANGVLTPVVARGWQAVLEGCARLFDQTGRPAPVRLYDVVPPDRGVPTDVLSLAAAAGQRLDLAVDVSGYGQGRLSVVLGRRAGARQAPG